jgi:hypothetical protein
VQLPEVIPIKYEPGYRTDRIGRYAGGQFFADVTGAYQEGVAVGQDWREQMRVYALLHRFNDSGHHVGSDVWFAGVRSDSAAVERAEEMLSGWLSDIGPVTFCDIAIRPFRVVFDDVVFGLIGSDTCQVGRLARYRLWQCGSLTASRPLTDCSHTADDHVPRTDATKDGRDSHNSPGSTQDLRRRLRTIARLAFPS